MSFCNVGIIRQVSYVMWVRQEVMSTAEEVEGLFVPVL